MTNKADRPMLRVAGTALPATFATDWCGEWQRADERRPPAERAGWCRIRGVDQPDRFPAAPGAFELRPAPKGMKRPATQWVKPGLIGRVKHLRGEEDLRHASLQDFREEG
jgi:hypothetical protein